MNYINKLKLPLYKYWLIGLAFYLLGMFVHWSFYLVAIVIWASSTYMAIIIRSRK